MAGRAFKRAPVVLGLLVALAALSAAARATRAPTYAERQAITDALPTWFQKYPVECVWLGITVSSSGQFAQAGPTFLNVTRQPCSRYAANGFWILKKEGPRWKIIFNGSDRPPCSLKIPTDIANVCWKGR
jgi:hypothetical protein